MNAKSPDTNLVRRHIWVDIDDWQWYSEVFGDKLGLSESIRMVMRKYRQGVEAKVAARAASHPAAGATLEDI